MAWAGRGYRRETGAFQNNHANVKMELSYLQLSRKLWLSETVTWECDQISDFKGKLTAMRAGGGHEEKQMYLNMIEEE